MQYLKLVCITKQAKITWDPSVSDRDKFLHNDFKGYSDDIAICM